jgi:acyl-CoA synthetase (AMP-forming)/AMP-acid ligase II
MDTRNLAMQINDCQASTIVVDQSSYEKISEIRPQLKGARNFITIAGSPQDMIAYEKLISDSAAEVPPIDLEGKDLCRIQYTTGSTGHPKGIMIPYRSDPIVLANLLIDNIPHLCPRDVFLGVQPIYHAVRAFILPCWIKGAAQVITHDFSPESVFDLIEKEGVTMIKTVPVLLNRLIDHPDIRKRDLRSIHTIIYGAAPMPTEKLKKAMEIFGPIFVQNYGQTEVPTTICCLNRDDHDIQDNPRKLERLSSAGRPYTHVEVKIVDDSGKEVPQGSLGEIIVRSEHAMIAYWNQPLHVTQETLRNGWIYTGDIGKMDEEGYVFLVDRKKDMIISGGYNVYPNQIEQILYKHPAVKEAAVVGVPHPEWGEAVAAVVAIKAGQRLTEPELIDFCKSHLPSFMKPQSISFWESLPKNPEGKILRKAIREQLQRAEAPRNSVDSAGKGPKDKSGKSP